MFLPLNLRERNEWDREFMFRFGTFEYGWPRDNLEKERDVQTEARGFEEYTCSAVHHNRNLPTITRTRTRTLQANHHGE